MWNLGIRGKRRRREKDRCIMIFLLKITIILIKTFYCGYLFRVFREIREFRDSEPKSVSAGHSTILNPDPQNPTIEFLCPCYDVHFSAHKLEVCATKKRYYMLEWYYHTPLIKTVYLRMVVSSRLIFIRGIQYNTWTRFLPRKVSSGITIGISMIAISEPSSLIASVS